MSGSHHIQSAFDVWLTRKLDSVFGAIAREPLPPDLQNLVQQLSTKEHAET